MMKIVSVVGARPQFIKAGPVSRILRQEHREILVHTGQHYDNGMSEIFFHELNIPQPDYNLGIGSGRHGWQTGRMLEGLETILLKEQPDWVVVYGDTNSTLAGALAGVKLHIPVAHIEAGLRSHNRRMPEEHNRVVTDHVSTLLLCPTQSAVQQLQHEGITEGVHWTGDVMYDALQYNLARAEQQSSILERLHLQPNTFVLCTIHRAENTDQHTRLSDIFTALGACAKHIILPLHPRTKAALCNYPVNIPDNIQMIDPVGYFDMLMLERHASHILTDSGGVQKEAYFLQTPCITLRDETEWIETVEAGWNVVVGTRSEKILTALSQPKSENLPPQVFGNGHASEQVLACLCAFQQ